MFHGNNFNPPTHVHTHLANYLHIHPSLMFLRVFSSSIHLCSWAHILIALSLFHHSPVSPVPSPLKTLSLSLKIYLSLLSLIQEKYLHSVLFYVTAVFSFIHISCLTSKPYTCPSDLMTSWSVSSVWPVSHGHHHHLWHRHLTQSIQTGTH